jgi:hypothetical protein
MILHGPPEDVAIKIVDFGSDPDRVALGKWEVAIMCKVSKQLKSYVTEFEGFKQRSSGCLLIAMKLAKTSLRLLIIETGRLPVDAVVRYVGCFMSPRPAVHAALPIGLDCRSTV